MREKLSRFSRDAGQLFSPERLFLSYNKRLRAVLPRKAVSLKNSEPRARRSGKSGEGRNAPPAFSLRSAAFPPCKEEI